ncbi:MAG: protein kinase [Deltaproteobacteria bacterium]|nr:protein kinase [Deltaproteobacteria bacterium]
MREKLGEGGHGVIYRAEQRGLGREAVIKVLHGRHGADAGMVARFLREAQLASRLDHPYAAHIYAFGAEPDGVLWLAMELVRGTPLAQVLRAQPGGRLALGRFVPLLDRLCEVVHTAHEQGIVHRDLKPDNVMVIARAGRMLPKLLDLGVARRMGSAPVAGRSPREDTREDPIDVAAAIDPIAPTLPTPTAMETAHSAVAGSPHYMAPEQWDERGEIDARADIYALGILTWEALTGSVPFRGAGLGELARAHRTAPLPAWPADLPPALGDVLRAALAKDPEARPSTALAFAEQVRAAAGLRVAADQLPRLDDDLRAEVAWLPQPIADAVAAFEAARNPHQARDGLWEIVRIAARWLGIVALAARSRVGSGGGDSPAVIATLRELPRRELADEEWLDLVRALARPFATTRDAHPLPELIDLALTEPSPFAPLFALRAAEGATTTEETLRDRLARTLPLLAPLLRALGFLGAYPVVVRRGDRAEMWMGPRRTPRPLIAAVDDLPEGAPALADLDGRPVLQLAPLAVIAPPSPGAADELFLFAGPGRGRGGGARLVAEPHGFERRDDAIWDWFRAHLLAVDDHAIAAVDDAPYRGLAAFTAKDADRFVGRERAAEAFLNQLRVTPLSAVVGPSGAGKSSFVQAGVLPLVPPDWRAIVMRPGATPRATLAARLAGSSTDEPCVLVIDQFEELFTLGADAEERIAFAAELVRLASERVHVVLTLRDDFLARTAELGPLRDRLGAGLTLLATPAPEDLRRIVVEPACRAGYDFDDDDLPARMVRAVAEQPGALALLSFTAARLWELRDRHFHRLTRAAYDAIGGVDGALAAHADATLAAMSADDQRLVREAFRHLVTALGTRAGLTRAELLAVLGDSARAPAVLERLIEARLLVASEAEGGDDRVELIHEALVTAWPRLVGWRRDDAEGARLRDQLRVAARQWQDRGRPGGLLWRDDALDDYRRWRARWPGALPEIDEAFAAASLRAAARGRRTRRVIASVAAAVLVSATIALALLYRSSSNNAETARDRLIASFIEQGRSELVAGDYLRALPYLSAAYSAGDNSLALRVMLHRALKLADQPVYRHGHRAFAAAFREDGTVMSIAEGGDAAVWDAKTGAVIAKHETTSPRDRDARGEVSLDGSVAAFPDVDAVVLWDGKTTRTLARANANRVAFDAAGKRLAVAAPGELSIWDVETGQRLRAVAHDGNVRQLAWRSEDLVARDRDGRVVLVGPNIDADVGRGRYITTGRQALATLQGNRVDIRSSDGSKPRTVEAPGAIVAVLSPDEHRIAVANDNGVIMIRDATGDLPDLALGGHGTVVVRLAFTPDGSRLASLGDDNTLCVWDVTTGREVMRYVGLSGTPEDLRFDAGGARAVVVSADGSARVFPIEDPAALVEMDVGEAVNGASFGRDGAVVYTDSETSVAIWDATRGARLGRVVVDSMGYSHINRDGDRAIVPIADSDVTQLRALPGGELRTQVRSKANVLWAAFDHAGLRFVTAGVDGTIDVWNIEGRHLASLVGHRGPVSSAAFSPTDDRLVTTGFQDLTVRIWDLAAAHEVTRVTLTDSTRTATFDRSGDRIVTASDDGVARMIDTRSGAVVRTFPAGTRLWAATIGAHADSLVAIADANGTISVWDAGTGERLTNFRQAARAPTVEFAPHQARLLSASNDHHAIVWDVDDEIADPVDVAAFVACRIPYRLQGSGLEAVTPPEHCAR